MKTLEQIKNDYAKSKGYYSWGELICSGHATILDNTIDKLLILVQKECLKNASENVTTVHHISQPKDDVIKAIKMTQQSITNENNIIK